MRYRRDFLRFSIIVHFVLIQVQYKSITGTKYIDLCLISTVSVLRTGMYKHNIDVKALFRLSDALKCVELGTTKPQLKSCVTGQFFRGFDFVVFWTV